jgi:hypothetical protein
VPEEFVSIQPNSSILGLYRSMDYKAWYALGEFIDNSYQSFLSSAAHIQRVNPDYRLRITIVIDSVEETIVIEDNAGGIPDSEMYRAFTPGVPPADRSGHHQFGIGMKAAAVWFADDFEISTRAIGEAHKKVVHFDVDRIISDGVERLKVERSPKSPDDHGTQIVLRKVRQLPRTTTITKIKSFLASMYRNPLRDDGIEIFVQNEKLTYVPPEVLVAPFWATNKGPGPGPDKIWREFISIQLPPAGKLQGNGPTIRGRIEILKTGSGSSSGISLLWRNKVVRGAGGYEAADEGQFKPSEIFGEGTSTKLYQRLSGEFDVSELDVKAFHDDIVWTQAQQEAFAAAIRRKLDEGPEPMRAMINNFSPSRLKDAEKQVEARAKAEASIKNALSYDPDIAAVDNFRATLSPASLEEFLTVSGSLSSISNSPFTCTLFDGGGADFLTAERQGTTWVFRVNVSHPFAQTLNDESAELVLARVGTSIARTIASLNASGQATAAHFFHREFERTLLAQRDVMERPDNV